MVEFLRAFLQDVITELLAGLKREALIYHSNRCFKHLQEIKKIVENNPITKQEVEQIGQDLEIVLITENQKI